MTNQLADDYLPPRTHNQPPLAERLAEELARYVERSAKLIEVARTAVIVDDDDGASARKVVDLVGLIRAVEKELDAAREAEVRPHVDAQRLINAHFGAVARPLAQVRAGADGKSGLRGMLTAYERKREAEAEAERAKAREEQRRLEAEAEAPQRAADDAAAAGKATVAVELAALEAQEAAEAAARRADAIRPEPIRAQLGQVGSRREIAFQITDLRKLLGALLKTDMKGSIEQAVRTIAGARLRQIGVDAIERGDVNWPGIDIRIEKTAAVRR